MFAGFPCHFCPLDAFDFGAQWTIIAVVIIITVSFHFNRDASFTLPALTASRSHQRWGLCAHLRAVGVPSSPAQRSCSFLCWVIIQVSHTFLLFSNSEAFVHGVISPSLIQDRGLVYILLSSDFWGLLKELGPTQPSKRHKRGHQIMGFYEAGEHNSPDGTMRGCPQSPRSSLTLHARHIGPSAGKRPHVVGTWWREVLGNVCQNYSQRPEISNLYI